MNRPAPIARRAVRTFALAGLLAGLCTVPAMAEPVLHPEKITTADLAPRLFPHAPESKEEGGGVARDVPQLHSADKKWMSGAYKVVGHNEFDTPKDGYEVNEFMYFLTGGVTLTSTDGTVVKAGPGDAVSIPKGWHGKWQSEGYSKFYVIYNPDAPVE